MTTYYCYTWYYTRSAISPLKQQNASSLKVLIWPRSFNRLYLYYFNFESGLPLPSLSRRFPIVSGQVSISPTFFVTLFLYKSRNGKKVTYKMLVKLTTDEVFSPREWFPFITKTRKISTSTLRQVIIGSKARTRAFRNYFSFDNFLMQQLGKLRNQL